MIEVTNEQWKPGQAGNCSKCRRQPYCSKECTNHLPRKINDLMRRPKPTMIQSLKRTARIRAIGKKE